MQNDFINGTLGTKEAQAIVPNVKKKIEEYKSRGDNIIFTRDTHFNNYLETNEGKNLPVKHCINKTYGWCIHDDLDEVVAVGDALGLPFELTHKVPSDGLCGKTDEDNFGFTYEALNKYLRTGVCEDETVKAKIDEKHQKNLFKTKPIPSFDPWEDELWI